VDKVFTAIEIILSSELIVSILLLIFIMTICGAWIKYDFKKNKNKNKVGELQNVCVELVEIEGNRAIFINHKLKKMYYIELDYYDLHYTEMELSYVLHYIPGWRRYVITHNDKVYKLFEI